MMLMANNKFFSISLTVLLSLSLTSCANPKKADKAIHAWDITKVHLKEPKDVVVSKLGGFYTPVALEQEKEYKLEIIEIAVIQDKFLKKIKPGTEIYYWFFFHNDLLYKFQRMTQGERLGGQTELKKFRDQLIPSLVISQLPI